MPVDLLKVLLLDSNNYEQRKVGRDVVGDYTISTCYTSDCGYETAIWKGDGNIIVVQYYPDKEEAKEGHIKWCGLCKMNPTKVYNVQQDRWETFDTRRF